MPTGDRFPTVLSAARERADWAWAQLYRELAPALLRFLVGQGAVDPEDCLAECFLQLVRNLDRFEGDEPAFRTWAFQIARHRAIDSWRAAGRRPVTPTAEPQELQDDRISAPAADHGLGELDEVERLLAGLTAEQRTVVLLRILDGFSVAETASIIGKSPGAVRVLQNRAIKALRRQLD